MSDDSPRRIWQPLDAITAVVRRATPGAAKYAATILHDGFDFFFICCIYLSKHHPSFQASPSIFYERLLRLMPDDWAGAYFYGHTLIAIFDDAMILSRCFTASLPFAHRRHNIHIFSISLSSFRATAKSLCISIFSPRIPCCQIYFSAFQVSHFLRHFYNAFTLKRFHIFH